MLGQVYENYYFLAQLILCLRVCVCVCAFIKYRKYHLIRNENSINQRIMLLLLLLLSLYDCKRKIAIIVEKKYMNLS